MADDGQPLDRRELTEGPERFDRNAEAPDNAPEHADWRSDKVIGNRSRDSAQALLDDDSVSR